MPQPPSMPTWWVAAAISAALTLGPAAPASADQVDVSVASSHRFMHSSSIDTVSEDDSAGMFSLNLGWRLNRVRLPVVDLAVDATFEAGSIDGTSFRRLETRTAMVSGLVGARAHWDVSEMVSFFARAGLGLTHISLELRDRGVDMLYIADDRLSASTQVGGGLDILPLRAPRRGDRGLEFGLRIEGGYFASTPVSMRAVPKGTNAPDDAILIPGETANLGSLNVSAWLARIGVTVRY